MGMNGKKLLISLLTCTLLLVLLTPAMAQEGEPAAEPVAEVIPAPLVASSDLYVTPLFRVNARSGPNTTYTVLGVVTPSDTLDITAQNEAGTWLRLNFSGQEAWVFADLMDVTGELEAAPVAEAGASAVLRSSVTLPVLEDDTDVETEESGDLEILTFFNTNMRDFYSTDAEVLATIPFDTLLIPQGRTDDNAWIMVDFEEQSGWVYAPILFFASGHVETLPVLATVAPAAAEE
jgi:uncharacterized protein YraI